MLNVDENMLILTDSSNCKRIKQLEDDIILSSEWKNMFNKKMPAYLNPNLFNFLKAQEPDFIDYTLEQMNNVATYVYTATYQGKDLEFEVDDDTFKWS